jgi:hypothetical protein
MADTRSTATVNTAMDAVIARLEAIGAGNDYAWLTAPVTVRRAGNPVEDLAAPRPALFVKVNSLSDNEAGASGQNQCKLNFQVACLGQLAVGADHDVWDLEADVRRAVLTGTTLGGLIHGGLFWTGSEAEVMAGSGGSNESIAVATFAGTVFWGIDSP